MWVSGPGLQWFSSCRPHPPASPVYDRPAASGPRAIAHPRLGTGGEGQSGLLPRWISNLEVQMAGVGSSVPFRASAWLFYEMTGTFISALAPFFSFSARLQRQTTRQEQGEEARSQLHPHWAGRPGLRIFHHVPLSCGGWEGSTEDQVKRGPPPWAPAGRCVASWDRSNHPFALCRPPRSSGGGFRAFLLLFLFF